MTRCTPDECAAFMGLAWADAKQALCLHVAGADKRDFTVWEHRPEVIEAWATDLLQRLKGPPIALALARNKGPLVAALRQYDRVVLFHSKPMLLATYRAAVTPSRAQDDPTAAARQLELWRRHREKRKPLAPQRPQMRA